MLKKLILSLMFLSLIFIGCQKEEEKAVAENASPNSEQVTVVEVLQANSYTYLKVKKDNEEYWIAVTKLNAEVGETFYHAPGMEMKNFESKDLGRTFESVFFIQSISKQPVAAEANLASPHGSGLPKHPETQKGEKLGVEIETAEGGITIATLFETSSELNGKSVKIKGKVTKFNSQIMGRNWVHLQDGTEYYGEFDLTLTTKEIVKVGDIVTFEGIVATEKDFGAGYKYKVIVEDSKLVK